MSKNKPPLTLQDLQKAFEPVHEERNSLVITPNPVQQGIQIQEFKKDSFQEEIKLWKESLERERKRTENCEHEKNILKNDNKKIKDDYHSVLEEQDRIKQELFVSEQQNKVLRIELNKSNSKLDAHELKEKQILKEMERIKAIKEKLKVQKAEITDYNLIKNELRIQKSVNTRLKNSIEVHIAEKTKCESERLKLKEKNNQIKKDLKDVKNERDDLAEDIETLNKELIKIQKSQERAESKYDELKQSLSDELRINSFETLEWMVISALNNHENPFNINLTLTGDGPWSELELSKLFRDVGLKPMKITARDSTKNQVIVVGRNADLESVEQFIIDREDQPIKLYPQELFIAGIVCGSDPFDLIEEYEDEIEYPEFIEAFGRNHPVIEYLRSLQFPWPKFDFDGGPLEPLEQVDESPLVLLDYRVGIIRGLPARERKEILRIAFEKEELPRVSLPENECDEYMRRWGKANSIMRLRRMAYHIASQIRIHRKSPNHDQAIADWTQDLDWLNKNFYKRIMRFNWPIV